MNINSVHLRGTISVPDIRSPICGRCAYLILGLSMRQPFQGCAHIIHPHTGMLIVHVQGAALVGVCKLTPTAILRLWAQRKRLVQQFYCRKKSLP